MKKKNPKKKSTGKRITKRQLWLGHYLDRNNPETFMNGTASALAAGYKSTKRGHLATIGSENYMKLNDEINQWLDEEGLSEAYLKQKLIDGLDANETKFFAHEGEVTDHRNVIAWGARQKFLDMALKVKGLYAPEVHKHEVEVVPLTHAEKLAYQEAADKIAQEEVSKTLLKAPDRELGQKKDEIE